MNSQQLSDSEYSQNADNSTVEYEEPSTSKLKLSDSSTTKTSEAPCNLSIDVDSKTDEKEAEHSSENKTTDTFKLDTSLIPTAHLESQINDELSSLGLTVFNQEEFEQNVIAQVDNAIEKEEEEKRKKQLTKNLAAAEDDCKLLKQEIARVDRVLTNMRKNAPLKEIKKLESVKHHKEKRLKEIKAKMKALHLRIYGNADGLEADEELVQQETEELSILHKMLAFGKSELETEQEKLIRTGEMTPFGSVTKDSNDKKPKGISLTSENDMSPFEKFLIEKEKTKTPPKRIKSSTATLVTLKEHDSIMQNSRFAPASSSAKKKKTNWYDERKKQFRSDPSPLKSHKSTSEPSPSTSRSSPIELDDSDGDFPTVKDCRERRGYNDSDDDWYPEDEVSVRTTPRKKMRLAKANKIRSAQLSCSEDEDDDDDGKCRLAKTVSTKRAKDDGNLAFYKKRLKQYYARKTFEKINGTAEESESDEESYSDAEFDGGLKVPKKIWKRLYKYQKTGVRWLWELHCQQAGGIIGDEMGLGKTIQTISFLAALNHSHLKDKSLGYVGLGPCIIVCPTTVMYQWVREFNTWFPECRVAVLHATGSFTGSEEKLAYSINNCNGVIVTSYNNLVSHQDCILKHKWHYIILDEGHKIRNPDAQATLACKMVRTPHRIILSGSPIQNNLKELWSLFDFVFPGKLGTLPDFMQHFSVPIVQGGYSNANEVQASNNVKTAYKCACVLRDTIGPYLLRRMKSDVKISLDLPDKNEQVLFCKLTDEQRDVYREYLDSRECQSILDGRYKVFAGLITLRKICNHPDISTGGPRSDTGEDIEYEESLRFGYWRRSGKMIVVEGLLRLWKQQGHRALLFSQSKVMLDILESFAKTNDYSYIRMDGTTAISARQPLITRFNEDSSIYLFLLTTRVGGLGVNLTGANRIIIYDPDWNPSTDTQARERAWRIGQKRQVTIYRLLTSGTIEEKIYHRQIFKQFLSNRVLKDPKQRRFFKANELHELFTLTDHCSNGTETGAMFAGTGSEVDVKPTKPNRFDLLKAGEDSVKFELSNKHKDKMRKLVKKLSKKIEKSKTESLQKRSSEEKVNGNIMDQAGITSDRTKVSGHSQEEDMSTEKSEQYSNLDIQPGTSCGGSHVSKKHKKSKHEKHKSKRKRHKDIYCDGEVISNLVKKSAYKYSAGDPEDKADNKELNSIMDDYVLQKLFKKSGVHSALKHDSVMDSSQADYLLVESEANQVAKQAMNALKVSRQRCNRAVSGIPTWTGSHGGSRMAGKKPRFGQKKNSLLVENAHIAKSPANQSPANMLSMEETKSSHFDGHVSGNKVLSKKTKDGSTLSPMTSQELLTRMKARKAFLNNSVDPDGEASAADIEFISDIRNFIAFQASIDGEASTEELLKEFKPKIAVTESAKFKAMLKEICNFNRKNGIGFWQLKSDFR
ncbi:SWI/SNF-related matrix-associated actin-dependent regulator of chromatin subfamily A member 5-like isoform X1 [Argonauta hians]